MEALLLLLLLAQQPDPPLKNWEVQRREPHHKTGQIEIVAVIHGDEALFLSTVRDKERIDIKGLRLNYFTDPRKPGEKSQEIRLTSDKAFVDNEKDRVDLAGHVRVENLTDGTVLEAPEATLFFRKRYVCPVHDGREEKAGRCPSCGTDLKSRTFTTIEAPKAFQLTKPDPVTHLTGEGLAANDDLRKMRIERDGFLITTGRPKELLSPSPPASFPVKPAVTELRSRGPMTFVESDTAVTVAAQKDVRIRRIEMMEGGPETTTVDADSAELFARKGSAPKKEVEPERLTARGRVTMETRDATARAETLVWTGSADLDLAELEGAPAEVTSGTHTIRSKTVTIERFLGTSTFKEDVAASLVAGTGPEAKPVQLKSRTLVTRAAAGGRELEEIEAIGDVFLEGLASGAGEKPARAEADRFVWSQGGNHGFLEKRPFVRIVQEESTLYAPKVVLEGQSMVVLKGPKRVVMAQKDAEGKDVQHTITSEGDIVLDSSGDATVIRLQDACAVRTPDVHLFADRMTVTTPKGSREISALRAWGRVRAFQVKEGATMFGEWLSLRPETKDRPQTMTLTGCPMAVIDAGRKVAVQEQVLVYEKADPVTGEKVQYQEMRGGKRGVKIIVDERPR